LIIWKIPSEKNGRKIKARDMISRTLKTLVISMVHCRQRKREAADILGVDQAQISRDRRRDANASDETDEPAEIDARDTTGDANASDLEQSRKREAALREQLKVAQTPATALTKRYGTIVIDPPWPMKKIEREVRPNQVEFDYPTMDYEQLRAFRSTFQDFTADDCHVFMWTTQKFLPMALRLFEDYGVKYVLTMVWHKPGGFQPIGLPQYNCEFVLYGRIGSPDFSDTKAFNCCFNAPRAEHSRKPDAFYDLVRRVTAGERLDIFSREARDGFDQFGNETGKFSEAAE
jgi:N6-adenosine-specific RNA methylase IME4